MIASGELPATAGPGTPAGMVVYMVRDLLFVSKIREAAEPLGVPLTGVRDVETLPGAAAGARLVVIDLGLPAAML